MNEQLKQRLRHMHLAGGAQAEAAALVEAAIEETLEDLELAAHEELCRMDADVIFGADRQEEYDRLLDKLAEELDGPACIGTEHWLYKAFFQLQTEMMAAQQHTDDRFAVVDKILRGVE